MSAALEEPGPPVMAAPAMRTPLSGVESAVAATPEFSFYQLVSLIDRFFADAPPVGSAAAAARERVRFGAHPSLAFPPTDIAATRIVSRADGEELLRLTVTFLGLYGPTSPLPASYTEQILFDDEGSPALRDFYDLFNHRLVALLYEVWTKHRYDMRFRGTGQDEISRSIFALMGLPTGGEPGHSGIRWERLLSHAGLLALPNCSPSVLERVLAHYFDVSVRVEEGVERLVTVPEAQRHQLGRMGHTLGENWVLGHRVRDVTGRFRIWLGPMTQERFDAFASGGVDHATLFELIRKVSRDSLDFEVRVMLQDGTVQPWNLGRNPSPLGWLLWLGAVDAMGIGVPLRAAA